MSNNLSGHNRHLAISGEERGVRGAETETVGKAFARHRHGGHGVPLVKGPPPLRYALLAVGLAAGMACGAVQPAAGPRPGPLADAPLAVIRPADFLGPGGTGIVVAAKGAVFGAQAGPLRVPVRAVFQIRRAGDYTLWIRSHQPPGAVGTLQAELARQGGVLAEGTFNDGAGSPARGGAEAWAEYRRLAVKNTSPRRAMADMQASLAGDINLHLILNRTAGVTGATDFAPYPFQDSIVRTISWNEPAGLTVSMQMDLEGRPDRLRTFRDHAREHYDMAIKAAGGRLHPLTRGKLFLRMSGDPTKDTEDYLFKTLRLLGANRLNSGSEPLAVAGRYGWEAAAGGAARMAWHLPFDEEESRRKYEEIYSHYANPAQRELYRQVSAMCMADEPGEGARAQMSSPLWLYVEEDGTPPKWVDPPGLSALHTRATNLTDCVLEGMFRKTGRIIEFRVATDSPEPAHFAFWRVGPNVTGEQQPENVGAGLDVVYRRNKRHFTRAFMHKAADIDDKPTRFKIVYEHGRAALFLDETLIHQHEHLRPAGGFGFAGDAKEIWDLRLRPVGEQERLSITGAEPGGQAAPLALAEDGDTLQPARRNGRDRARSRSGSNESG